MSKEGEDSSNYKKVNGQWYKKGETSWIEMIGLSRYSYHGYATKEDAYYAALFGLKYYYLGGKGRTAINIHR